MPHCSQCSRAFRLETGDLGLHCIECGGGIAHLPSAAFGDSNGSVATPGRAGSLRKFAQGAGQAADEQQTDGKNGN